MRSAAREHKRAVHACRQRVGNASGAGWLRVNTDNGCAPRNVYVDAGVNWCNTLTLHRALPKDWIDVCANRGAWLVYGFEASSLLHPYVERCTQWLSAGRGLPKPPVPPAGSTKELRHYASRYNLGHCFNKTFLGMAGRSSFAKAYQFNRKFGQLNGRCLEEALRSRLQKLEVPAAKADAGLLQMRLASGSHCGPPPTDTYTLLPAAVSKRNGSLRVSGNLASLVRGGLRTGLGGGPRSTVAAVDLAGWLRAHFSEADFLVLKMDVEGAEHDVIHRLVELNATRIVDVFLWECHPRTGRPACREHGRNLKKAGVRFLAQEPYDAFYGFNLTRLAKYDWGDRTK